MTGVSIRLDGTKPTLAILEGIEGRITQARPMYDEIGGYLETSVSLRFEREQGPGNSPWPKSLRALATGGKTLTDSARLRQSMTHNASDTSVEHGTNVEYAAIHQFGGVIKAKTSRGLRFKFKGAGGNRASWATKQQVTIPARPFIGLDDQDETAITTIVERYIAAAAGGADAR